MNWNVNEIPSQNGKTAIVTGANIGLGYETAKVLAQKEAKVILACRNQTKAKTARDNILIAFPKADLEIMILDLNSLESVRSFSSAYLEKHDRLDLLINNAGIMMPPFTKTEDGFESQMGVNYFGHFALTSQLLGILNKTAGARVVSLSSIAHRGAKIDFDNLNAENGYSKFGAYGQSKLACLMFAYELNRRLKASGSNVLSLAAHPGGSNTNLAQHLPKLLYRIMLPFMSPFLNAPSNAAQPTLMAALAPTLKGGEYTGPTGFNEMNGKPGIVGSKPQSHDLEVAKRLWQVSEKLTNTMFNI